MLISISNNIGKIFFEINRRKITIRPSKKNIHYRINAIIRKVINGQICIIMKSFIAQFQFKFVAFDYRPPLPHICSRILINFGASFLIVRIVLFHKDKYVIRARKSALKLIQHTSPSHPEM